MHFLKLDESHDHNFASLPIQHQHEWYIRSVFQELEPTEFYSGLIYFRQKYSKPVPKRHKNALLQNKWKPYCFSHLDFNVLKESKTGYNFSYLFQFLFREPANRKVLLNEDY